MKHFFITSKIKTVVTQRPLCRYRAIFYSNHTIAFTVQVLFFLKVIAGKRHFLPVIGGIARKPKIKFQNMSNTPIRITLAFY